VATHDQKELDLAKEARKGNWKETITLLEVQIELERQERQAFAATIESTMADLERKNEELRGKIHEQEQSEKHCHQVLNLLDNFIESHPGEGGEFRHSLVCTKIDKVAVEKTMVWFEWAGEEIRCAKEMEEVRARSTKRRKIRIDLTINVQDEHSPPATVAPPAEHAQMTAQST
jgi:hypothetical protein